MMFHQDNCKRGYKIKIKIKIKTKTIMKCKAAVST
jgi:hypothetical protein